MPKVTGSEIVEEIYKHRADIIENIKSESIYVYLWLKDQYEKGNVRDALFFQFVFRSFYGLDGAGLSDDQKERYFVLLADKKDFETVLKDLYELPTRRKKNNHTIQFIFATKLLHTIDNTRPIFDTEVSTVIGRSRSGGDTLEAKIKSARSIYDYLQDLYINLLD